MAHIVFVLGSYHPSYSAIGICVKNIVNEISKKNQVSVICNKNTYTQLDKEIIDNINVVRASSKINTLWNKIQFFLSTTHGIKKYLFINILNLTRVFRYVSALILRVNVQWDLVNVFEESLIELNKTSNIDVVIPCCFPIEGLIASERYCRNRETKLIPYLFDNFIKSKKLHRTNWNKKIKHKSHVKLLRKIFSNSNHIIAMNSLEFTFVQHFSTLQDKITYVEHPLLIKLKGTCHKPGKSIDSPIKLTYAGSFLKGYVDPNYFFKLFFHKNFKNFKNFEINLYSRGNCGDLVNNFILNNPVNSTNHGSVNFEKAQKAICDADFLINVAETSGKQMSSKIFTYMSAGKPIIHFYSYEDDINKLILDKYPLVVCIKQDLSKLMENVLIVEDFIINNNNKFISFELVRDIYPDALPRFTSDIIEKLSYEV
jgi:hypothetical protein